MAQFPSNFMKGVGLSVWQNSSDTSSNWSHFTKKKQYFGQKEYTQAWEKSNDFWNEYERHITLAREQIGTNAFRFSFEWSRFQPNGPGEFDAEAVDRFHRMLDCIAAQGMEPMVTLHHFTHPQWFEEKGGFEDEDNIPYFLDYCTKVFQLYGSRIRLWATFNEPTCFAFVGYIIGLWCPGKMMKFALAGKVLLCLLKAHVLVYDAIKALPHGRTACIGMVHQHVQFVPKQKFIYVKKLCHWMTYWFASETILCFFKTGVFKWKMPLAGTVIRYTDESAPSKLDWWGINYYSRPCIDWRFAMGASADNEPVSDTNFRLYPQGLYDSIAEASVLGKPIYITETGLADKADKHRHWFVQTHFNTILKAISDGYDVRGVFWWTLMDNIEWHEGFHIKFGLFEWDPDPAVNCKGITMREGSKRLVEMYASWPDTVAGVLEYAAANKNRIVQRLVVIEGGPTMLSRSSSASAHMYGLRESKVQDNGTTPVQMASADCVWETAYSQVSPQELMGPGTWAQKRDGSSVTSLPALQEASLESTARGSARGQATREAPGQAARESTREATREAMRESTREATREAPGQAARESTRESTREAMREATAPATRESMQVSPARFRPEGRQDCTPGLNDGLVQSMPDSTDVPCPPFSSLLATARPIPGQSKIFRRSALDVEGGVSLTNPLFQASRSSRLQETSSVARPSL